MTRNCNPTVMTRCRQRATQTRRHGFAYIFVMGVSLAVLTISLASMHVLRIERQSAQDLNDVVRARIYARTAIEYGFWNIKNDPTWRTTRGLGSWFDDRAIGEGLFSLAAGLADGEVDLPSSDGTFVLIAKGSCGSAIHRMCVEIRRTGDTYEIVEDSWKKVVVDTAFVAKDG